MYLALNQEEGDMLAILSDSLAVIQVVVNMSSGAPPRTGIEAGIKTAMITNQMRDVKIA